jgi:hypothetical protein
MAVREGGRKRELAKALDSYAALLRETGRADKTAELKARAKAICAKYE